MHSEFLVIDKGKMAKSGENFLTLAALIEKGYDPLVYRYFCLTASYRQQLSFSWEGLDSAKSSHTALRTKIIDLHEHKAEGANTSEEEHQHRIAFGDAINDDLNMPQALAALWVVLRDEKLANERKIVLAEEFDRVLGLGIKRMGEKDDVPEDIKALAHERHEAKAKKDWTASDRLRDQINAKGYVIDDKKDGTYSIRKA
jgi:cysteinyl-tRNA synthetase